MPSRILKGPTTRASLLIRIRNPEDSASWNDFERTYYPFVLSFVRKTLPTLSDAEDLVQEVFVRVVHAIPQFTYDPTKKFRNWLFRIVRNEMIDWLRKHQKRREAQVDLAVLGLESIDELSPVETDPLWPVFEREWTALCEKEKEVVRRKMPRQYQIYHLYVVQGWPMERVVREMEVTAGYVSKAKHMVEAAIQEAMVRLEQGGDLSSGFTDKLSR